MLIQQVQFDLSDLPGGLYFLELRNGIRLVAKRIIKTE